jgi:DNA-binding MarR family transcriptional regulator
VAEHRPLPFDPIAEAERQWTAHGWGDAAKGMAAVTSVIRAEQIFLARIDAELRPLGLTFARYELLVLLLFSRRGRLPLGKIGVRLQVQAGSVTNAVDRLEQQGLVRRRDHPSDGRTTLAEITPEGRRLARRATARLNQRVFTTTAFSDRQLDQFVALLRDFRRAAGDFD